VSEIALWDRTGWRLSLAASWLATRKTGRPPDDSGRRCDHFTTLAMLTINVLATGRQD
jgi:hypothetical protein